MKTKTFFAKKGFTLIEILVVAAIVGFLGLVSAVIISSILTSQNKTLVTNNIKQNGDYATEIFERDVKQAYSTSSCELPGCWWLTLNNSEDAPFVTWKCEPSGTANVLKRQPIPGSIQSVTNEDPKNGTNISDCTHVFKVPNSTDITYKGKLLVTIEFTLNGPVAGPSGQEFKSSVDFNLTVGTRTF
jgi:prepilin-type N-terminal cleavage/methylation domain-containing protein